MTGLNRAQGRTPARIELHMNTDLVDGQRPAACDHTLCDRLLAITAVESPGVPPMRFGINGCGSPGMHACAGKAGETARQVERSDASQSRSA
jgi:hypothetical protein